MKAVLAAAIIAASFSLLGCAPSDQPSTPAEPTPAVAEAEPIAEMDFESGEVEGEAASIDAEPDSQPE